ncbi:hypothetical protein [Sphingobium sp. CCH11-B1]|uniref:hypothetical protein n=1 Tax=Sphingobium sp. CCH11-B1 TaxID=1768781 RepID=UPI0008366029|nr:hypothetical protein [Sphingobium sp. CCH11-B1]
MRHRDIIDVAHPFRPFAQAIVNSHEEIVEGYLKRRALSDAASFQRELIDAVDAMSSDTIGAAWRKAHRLQLFRNPAKATAWKARAISLDPTDPHMSIALASFAPMQVDGKWHLAIPLPIPCPLGAKSIEPDDIVLIEPATGNARLYSGDTDTLISADKPDSFTAMADAKVWAREIAASAVEWFYRRCDAAKIANVAPTWSGLPSSALAIGNPGKIIWPHVTAITAGAGIDAAQLKKTIFRQARITHVESPMQIVRAA